MLPKNRLGRQMLRKLAVYEGADHPHQAQQPVPLRLGEIPRWQGLPERSPEPKPQPTATRAAARQTKGRGVTGGRTKAAAGEAPTEGRGRGRASRAKKES